MVMQLTGLPRVVVGGWAILGMVPVCEHSWAIWPLSLHL